MTRIKIAKKMVLSLYFKSVLMVLSFLQGNPSSPFIVAHRGASFDAPENTLPAFIKAWEDGADAIEGDFHLTADGKVVCIHDSSTGRVAKENLVVKDATLEELQQLDVGSWKGEQWKGTTILTLLDVLATVPSGKKIYVEIKSGIEIIPQLLRDLETSGLTDEQIVIISFDPEVIKVFKEKRPSIRANWLVELNTYEDGTLNFSPELMVQLLKSNGANGVSTNYQHVQEPFVKEILTNGFEYHVWTVDDKNDAQKLLQMGVMSITTNKPLLMDSLQLIMDN